MKILLLDNYDSFTWNIFHYVQQVNENIDVFRNDEIGFERVEEYSHIILSPGPGLPKDAGRMPEILERFSSTKKILGICLGMQAIAEHFGGELYNMEHVTHGVSTPCHILKQDLLFEGVESPFEAGRYHSWAVKRDTLPSSLEIIAEDPQHVAMAIRHTQLPVYGIQFHPESVLTQPGFRIISNWLKS